MAARKQFLCLQKVLKASNLINEVLSPSARYTCLSYQQRRHKRYYNARERPQKETFHRKEEPDPILYDPLTDESMQFLEDDFVRHVNSSPLRNEPWERHTWTNQTRRLGVLAIKLGNVPLWKKDGTRILTCMLQVLDNHVIKYVPPEIFQKSPAYKPSWLEDRTHWGSAVVGAITTNPWDLHPDFLSMFTRTGVPPKKRLTRFLVTPDAAAPPGTPLNVTHFNVGDYVDCSARSIDHGFQGVMKRWGFKGMPASHGTTKSHRQGGSMSSGKQKGLWKGSKAPGLMGDRWSIHKGCKIWRMNIKHNILYVTTGVPGPSRCFVRVYDSALHKHIEKRGEKPEQMPMPTRYPEDFKEPLPEEIYDDEILPLDSESITFAEES